MIYVTVNLICGHSKDSDRTIFSQAWPQVPDVGELININGNPYIVYDRGWAASEDSIGERLYAFLRVSPFQQDQKSPLAPLPNP